MEGLKGAHQKRGIVVGNIYSVSVDQHEENVTVRMLLIWLHVTCQADPLLMQDPPISAF
jgi:hypothetical protein